MRESGILMPVSSLPGPYGIGCFGKEAFKFVDFLAQAGQKIWQILPLSPTGYGDSPYQSCSAFAGNPYFIDLDALKEEGLLTAAQLKAEKWGTDPKEVDYGTLYVSRFKVLRTAYTAWRKQCAGLHGCSYYFPDDYYAFTLANEEWLENYLKSYSGAVLVVSHDRYFLDNVCTKIWEVSFQTMTTYKGNFSAYLPQKEAADALRQKQHDADVALAEKLQDYVDRNLVRASTTKMAQSRRKQLEKLEITEAPKDETNQLKFRFEYDVEPWNELVLLKNLTIKIGERTLLEPFTYTVCRGQRLVIAGPNGAGKSTLMQVLDGKRRPSGGMVRLGTGARPSIFAQQQNRLGQGRVIDVIWNKYPRMTELEVRSHLAKLGFRGETVFKPCEALSGGELARLRFAEIVLERPNLLFLDEPTNHLDIYTRENLTEALMAYTGTLLLVTHDRHLMNSLACPILYLEDGKATLYPSYDALMGRNAPAPAVQKAAEPAKTGYGREQRRRRAELRAKIKACEDEMEACGAREVELDNEINSPEVYNDPDLLRQKSDELSDLRFHQEELFAAWEAAMEEQESYEQSQQTEE